MTVGIIRSGNATSLSTTTKVEITPTAGLFMPSDAKALLAVNPRIATVLTTTVQSVGAKLDVESTDVRNLTPFEVLFPPIGAPLGTVGNTFTGNEEYKINAPLQGGENLKAYASAIVTNTQEPVAMVYFTVSNDNRDLIHPLTRQMMVQQHAKMSVRTSSGIARNTDVAGTKYSFSGGRRITELIGEFLPGTVAANDALIGSIKFTSSEFVDSIPQELPLLPFSYGLGVTGSVLIPGVSRQKVNIPVKPGQVNIQDYLNCSLLPAAQTAPHYFIDGVIYE